jgi:hypothetical protein
MIELYYIPVVHLEVLIIGTLRMLGLGTLTMWLTGYRLAVTSLSKHITSLMESDNDLK